MQIHLRKAPDDNLGSTAKCGCHLDLEEGQEPDGCVLDEERPEHCIYAKHIDAKQKCQYWRPVQVKL